MKALWRSLEDALSGIPSGAPFETPFWTPVGAPCLGLGLAWGRLLA